jgi:hypothetical protein
MSCELLRKLVNILWIGIARRLRAGCDCVFHFAGLLIGVSTIKLLTRARDNCSIASQVRPAGHRRAARAADAEFDPGDATRALTVLEIKGKRESSDHFRTAISGGNGISASGHRGAPPADSLHACTLGQTQGPFAPSIRPACRRARRLAGWVGGGRGGGLFFHTKTSKLAARWPVVAAICTRPARAIARPAVPPCFAHPSTQPLPARRSAAPSLGDPRNHAARCSAAHVGGGRGDGPS